MLLAIILYGSFHCFAQTSEEQHKIDSLEDLRSKSKSKTEKADITAELGLIYYYIDLEKGISTTKEAIELYPEKELVKRGKARTLLAKMLLRKDNELARKSFLDAAEDYKKAKGQDSLVAYMYMCAGRTLYNEAKYDGAMKYYIKAKDLYDKKKIYDIHHGELHHYIGSVYKRQKDMDMACEWYNRELSYSETYNLLDVRAEATYLLASCAEDIQEEIRWSEQALELYEKMDDTKMIALLKGNLSGAYMEIGGYDKAERYLHDAIKVFEKRGDSSAVAHQLSTLGELYVETKEFTKAQEILKRAEKIAQHIQAKKYIRLATIHKGFYHLYKAMGDYKSALESYKTHVAYKDSSIQAEYKDEVLEMDVRYNTAQNELKISRQEAEIAQQKIQQQEELFWKRILISGIVVALLFGLVIFNRYKVSTNQKRIIELQKQEVEKKNKEIMDSIVYAKRIQAAILPPKKIIKEYLNKSFILYIPKDIVAGDFYWMEHLNNTTLFAAADCTGHGVPGAMVSVVCNNGLNRAVREHGLLDPGKILDKTREIVVSEFEKSEEDVKDGMDIALCSLEGNTLRYAGAHNPLWIIRKDSNEIEEIKADKQPIGQSDNPIFYKTHTIKLNEGDTFYLFSDGFADQFGGEHGKKYLATNFKQFLLSIKEKDMQEQKELIEKSFYEWKGDLEQLDDVCVLGVRI